jgi:hypothetical protein
MIVTNNDEVRRILKTIHITTKVALEKLEIAKDLIQEGAEIDAVDKIAEVDEAFYIARKALFDARLDVDRLRKTLDKHVAHCLNPIAKTAPKKEKSISARKEEGGYQSVTIVHDGKTNTETVYLNGNKQPAKHSTISRANILTADSHTNEGIERIKKLGEDKLKANSIVPKGNAPQSNPAHDRPFDESDNDIPF